ncbi:MAG: hypothetical protein C0402_13655 [Thermodesulfovibrio sp.]|nr:hypothetical protein [Thermodesulfovibrio sp.]
MNKISKVIKARWPEDNVMPSSRPVDEFSSNLEVLLDGIRKYKMASWAFAIILGLLYRYGYGLVKDIFWGKRDLNFIAGIFDLNSKIQEFFATVGVNFIVDLSSIILPAVICGAVLIYIFHTKARLFSLAAVVPFLVFSRRAWHFWEAPGLGLQISILFAPILGVVALLAVVFIKTKNEKTAEQTARPDGE